MMQNNYRSDIPLVHQRIVLINVYKLLGHEEVVRTQIDWIKENLIKLDYFFRPILVAKNEFVVLDGHHRVAALREVGEEKGMKTIKIPSVEIEYIGNSEITLGTWHPLYTKKNTAQFPAKLEEMNIKYDPISSFSTDIFNNPKYSFTLKTDDNQYFALQGTQQSIYKKFLNNFEPEAFDYAKTLESAINSVDDGRIAFALLRTHVTKEDVLKTAKSKIPYAPKTTRHILSFRYQDTKVPLATLFQP